MAHVSDLTVFVLNHPQSAAILHHVVPNAYKPMYWVQRALANLFHRFFAKNESIDGGCASGYLFKEGAHHMVFGYFGLGNPCFSISPRDAGSTFRLFSTRIESAGVGGPQPQSTSLYTLVVRKPFSDLMRLRKAD